jgi:hypothetical protein
VCVCVCVCVCLFLLWFTKTWQEAEAKLVPWEQRRNEREKDEMCVRQKGGSDKEKDEIYI